MCFHRLVPLVISTGIPATDHTRPVQTQNTPAQLCAKCSQPVKSEFKWCPQCGAPLKDFPCAYCGQILKPGASVCKSCGAPTSKSRRT